MTLRCHVYEATKPVTGLEIGYDDGINDDSDDDNADSRL